jgi:alpha-tubulin suppressor-like RCC1 family protein
VGSAGDWAAARAGRSFTLGARNNGDLYAWGRGDDGQRGDGTYEEDRETPWLVGAGYRAPTK